MTIHLKDTREGIEAIAVSVPGIKIEFATGTKLTAYEIMRLSQAEGVYLSTGTN